MLAKIRPRVTSSINNGGHRFSVHRTFINMAYKRMRVSSTFRRNVRRRRNVTGRFSRFRRTFRRTGRRITGLSTQSLAPRNVAQFRSHRIRKSAYRRKLWNDSLMEAHYRSVLTSSSIGVTPNDINNMTVTRSFALPSVGFWVSTGGAQPVDTGVALGTFGRSIVIRGGVCRACVANPNADIGPTGGDTLRVTVYGVWTVKNPNFTGFPVASVPQSWDPSVIPDFSMNVGKVILRRDFMLQPNGGVEDVYYRMKPRRVDQIEYLNGGNQLMWVFCVGQLTNTETIPAAESYTYTVGHNLSFVGDEIA